MSTFRDRKKKRKDFPSHFSWMGLKAIGKQTQNSGFEAGERRAGERRVASLWAQM